MLPNQTEVIKRLSELSRMLDAATEDIAKSDDFAVKAKASYEVAFAKSFLSAEGSMDQRKQIAIMACADEKFAMEIAEAQVRAVKERINTLRSQISIGQSLSAAIRQQFSSEGIGQYT
jgi:phage shock protein A